MKRSDLPGCCLPRTARLAWLTCAALLLQAPARGGPVDEPGFDAGAVFRDTPTHIRDLYRRERPEYCTTDPRLIYDGKVYVSPDTVTMRIVAFHHNDTAHKTLEGPEHLFRLIFEVPESILVRGGAPPGACLTEDARFPQSEKIDLDGRPGTRYTLAIPYIQNLRSRSGNFITYFQTTLPAGRTAEGRYHLRWKTGRQAPQPVVFASLAIPPVAAPRRMFIMPWGINPVHVELLAPNFPDDYTRLGMNMFGFDYLGHWGDDPVKVGRKPGDRERYYAQCESLAARARAGGVFMSYGGTFFPTTAGAPAGMIGWVARDPAARAIGVDGKPVAGWLAGYVPCPSYRGRYYQEAVATLAASEQIRRVPTSFYNFDTEYYSSRHNGQKICFCTRCVAGFEQWFAARHPDEDYVDPFTIEKHTVRPDPPTYTHRGIPVEDYEVASKFPVQYRAWVTFKIEQFGGIFLGFKRAIESVVGATRTAPFDRVIFADWAALYPPLLLQERHVFGPSLLHDRVFDLMAVGAYGPPAYLIEPLWDQYTTLYYETMGLRRSVCDTPAPSGSWVGANYAPMPEHARYYLLESAMNGVQGQLLFPFTGLEGRQLQLNSRVFGAFALVDDIITTGDRVRDLRIDGPEMHARGLALGDERLVLVGDHYTETDARAGVLTCPVERMTPVHDLLTRRKLGELNPADPTIAVQLRGLNDRARFLYVGGQWARRLAGATRDGG